MIPFNKPYSSGKEIRYMEDVISSGALSANGKYTKLCQEFIEEKYGVKKCFLTNSCTAALEMAAILLDIKEGDEVIMPSYTFVSTANAFVLRGAKIVFADSKKENPCIDEDLIEPLITGKTKAIVVVHYGGIACNMDRIMDIALKHQLFVVEDAAQSIDSFYIGKNGKKALGSIGHLGALSFHDTKNITSGEGGMLMVNAEQFIKRSEIIWEKGTNRSAFFRNEVDQYGWKDVGSSFSPSDLTAAFLMAQLENIEIIQQKRVELWNLYHMALKKLQAESKVLLQTVPHYSTNNGHMFYMVCGSLDERSGLIQFLRNRKISSSFHYLSLHKSSFYKEKYTGNKLLQSDKYSERLVRLPLFYELTANQVNDIAMNIEEFYSKNRL